MKLESSKIKRVSVKVCFQRILKINENQINNTFIFCDQIIVFHIKLSFN